MFQNSLITYEEKTFYERGLRLADPSFFKMFTFPFLKGNPDTALNKPYSIVISEAIAKKYFGSEDPIGKVFTMNQKHELTVTGIMEDVPRNSTLRFNMIVPIEFRILTEGSWYTQWYNFFTFNFVKLQDNCSVADFNAKIADVVSKRGGRKDTVLEVLPFADRYFFFLSNKTYIYVFFTIAAFILAIACFNFMSLSTD